MAEISSPVRKERKFRRNASGRREFTEAKFKESRLKFKKLHSARILRNQLPNYSRLNNFQTKAHPNSILQKAESEQRNEEIVHSEQTLKSKNTTIFFEEWILKSSENMEVEDGECKKMDGCQKTSPVRMEELSFSAMMAANGERKSLMRKVHFTTSSESFNENEDKHKRGRIHKLSFRDPIPLESVVVPNGNDANHVDQMDEDVGLVMGKGIERQVSITKLYNISHVYEIAYPCIEDREGRQSFMSLITGLYAINLILIAIAIEFSVIMNPTKSLHVKIYYTYLYVVSLIFFAFCDVFMFNTFSCARFRSRKSSDNLPDMEERDKVSHSSKSAGSLYLRLGCIAFGLGALIFFGLNLVHAVSAQEDILSMVNLFLASAFTFLQMFFIFRNSNLTIHRFKSICRFGTMHLVATNLSTWIRYLLLDELHNKFIINYVKEDDEAVSLIDAVENSSVLADNKNPCESFTSQGYTFNCEYENYGPLLTTCLIQYSIICAAIMFILWINIGTPNIYKSRKQNFRVDCSASTKGLFIGLLVNVLVIISMVIFFVQIGSKIDNDALYILYTSDFSLNIASLTAIAYGAYQMRNLSFVRQHKAKNLLLLDDILLFVGMLGQITFCLFSVVALISLEAITILLIVSSVLRLAQVMMQTIFIVGAQRLIALTPYLQNRKPGREVVTFLIMVNLAQFLIKTFETQRASAHPIVTKFYGDSTWSVLVHSMVPLTIFYRFHSTVCLAEIWKNAYRRRNNEEHTKTIQY